MRAKLIKSKPCDILVRRQQKKGHNFKNHVHDVRPTLRPRCTGYNNFSFWFQRLEAFLSSTKKNQSGVNYDLSSRFRELILEQKNYSWYIVVKAVNLSAPFLVFTALILILWSTIHTSKFSQVNKEWCPRYNTIL